MSASPAPGETLPASGLPADALVVFCSDCAYGHLKVLDEEGLPGRRGHCHRERGLQPVRRPAARERQLGALALLGLREHMLPPSASESSPHVVRACVATARSRWRSTCGA